MPQVINTNVLSLNAQRNLTTSGTQLATALQRLSSGLRINSAKDDAAGLAISDRMTTQINGLNQAVRNANDGISLAQTTEGALQEVTNNLQRIRELAVQAANATNSTADRVYLNQEVQERIAEIERIATQTSFNGRKVLDGTFGNAVFQVGANVGETISVSLGADSNMRSIAIGRLATAESADISGLFMIGGQAATSGSYTTQAIVLADYSGTAAEFTIDGHAVTLNADYTASTHAALAGDIQADLDAAAGAGVYTVTVVNGNQIQIAKTATGAASTAPVFANVNNAAAFAGGTQVDGQDAQAGTPQDLELTAGEFSIQVGNNTAVAITGNFASGQALADAINAAVSGVYATFDTTTNQLKLVSAESITITGTQALAGAGNLGFNGTNDATGALAGSTVLDTDAANLTIQRVDSALTAVSSFRSTLGAIQNRFQSTINSLQAVSENLSASRSRILDADFAAETAALTRAQILQQAGTAMVAQANSIPQNVLALLR
ncbi:MAG TPA: flagellin [Steroidobacteraceae bacterium]